MTGVQVEIETDKSRIPVWRVTAAQFWLVFLQTQNKDRVGNICELNNTCKLSFFYFFFNFLRWGKTESTWYVCHELAYCTSPG
jgi:hypothetical protein